MNRIVVASSALFLFAPFAAAQMRPQAAPQARPQAPAPQMRPLPGMPMVPPPVPHPGLAAQPLANGDAPAAPSSGGASPAPAAMPEPAAPPAETAGPKLEGKDLKKVVAKVKALKWNDSLLDAKARSAATGKPVLLLQALGDIDGFA